ncbi:SDR family NAD(P)-dependent oxidoreductase [Dongia soli]|uniref:SDR family oxidoreductase n=1 Tax=Dongia soli TaxID=600628 RepID=A0ABU5EFJ3_9PROT|nr:SDR family oxidoreductase [Dongia soli]MDY0884677.1 SDR family oxidoreductase [Dongia soli]
MGKLNGKRALVTGGSRGIGAAIARRLAAEGADVAITYQRSAEAAEKVAAEIRATGRKAVAIAADSADSRSGEAAVAATVAKLGGLDILVNNAGIFETGKIEELSLADIERNLAVNVTAVVLASRAAILHFGPGSRIINIGSCLASQVPAPGMAIYAMTKSALVGLTKGLARDLGATGTTVNVVHPGPTDTDMNPAAGDHAEGQRQRIALGHYGTADDIAASVAFLASEDGRHITGAELAVDGGVNA